MEFDVLIGANLLDNEALYSRFDYITKEDVLVLIDICNRTGNEILIRPIEGE